LAREIHSRAGKTRVGNSTPDRAWYVLQGTLALMVPKSLDVLGPLHGYGIARRIEQISGHHRAILCGERLPGRQGGKTKRDCGRKSKNISLCKLPRMPGPVYRRSKRGVRLC
jgi:hypothetical protein